MSFQKKIISKVYTADFSQSKIRVDFFYYNLNYFFFGFGKELIFCTGRKICLKDSFDGTAFSGKLFIKNSVTSRVGKPGCNNHKGAAFF